MTEPEITDAPRELLALACAARPDWDRDQAWSAMLAAKSAGWTFPRLLREITRLLLIADSSPSDLRYAAGETRTAPTGSLPGDLRAKALADCQAAAETFRQQRHDPGAAA